MQIVIPLGRDLMNTDPLVLGAAFRVVLAGGSALSDAEQQKRSGLSLHHRRKLWNDVREVASALEGGKS